MTESIPILLLGISILVLGGRLLVQWAKKDHAHVVSIEDYSSARAALDSMCVETAAIRRVFATEDREFISESSPPDVQRFFLKERKKLAIQWLRIIQKRVKQLTDLHLNLAGYTFEPSPRFEFKLTVNYLCFLIVSNGLLVLVWWRGPFELARIVAYTVRGAEHFCSVFSLRLETVDPVKLGSASGLRSAQKT